MGSSSTSTTKACTDLDLRYASRKCRCGKRAAIRVVESDKPSKGKLYYVCEAEPRGCYTWAWCKPVRINQVENEKVQESPRIEDMPLSDKRPMVVPEDLNLMARLAMVEANLDANNMMMKWIWWTSTLCVFCTILVLMMK